MDVLIGTTNPSKVQMFERMLRGHGLTFLTLGDLGVSQEPQETGATPEENARIKAAFYGRIHPRVICNDSGLYFAALSLDDPRQPGLHVRTPRGVRLDDEQMIAYYAALARSLGGRARALYLNGYAVCREGRVFSLAENDLTDEAGSFDMVDRPSPQRHPGWPLDSLSIDRRTGAYFTDDTAEEAVSEAERLEAQARRARLVRFLEASLGL